MSEITHIDMTSVGTAISLIGLTYIVMKRIIYPLYLHPLAKLPGPPVDWIPFLGNFREIVNADFGDATKKWKQEYGPIYCTYEPLNLPRVNISDPGLFKQVLTIQQYDFIKTPDLVFHLSKILGHGLFLAEAEEHKRQRKLLNPAFSLSAVKNLVPLIYKPVFDLFKRWDDQVLNNSNGQPTPVVLTSWMSLVTLDVIGLAAFGQEFNSTKYSGSADGKVNDLSWAYSHIFDPNQSIFSLALHLVFPIMQKVPTQRSRNYQKALRLLAEESQRLVDQGIARSKNNTDLSIGSSSSSSSRHSLLSLMIDLTDDETGHGMSPNELREQCMTFLTAGHETTAVSLSWCLWLLAKHQGIQDALRAEVTSTFEHIDPNNESTYPDFDTVSSLHLLNNVCKENSRLLPVVPGTVRYSTKDTTLGGYFIPKNTTLFVQIMPVHHDKSIWGDDAEEFRPSRWDKGPATKVTAYEYMPFLAGGRQCIGYRFALIELKIILGLLITKYQFFEKPGFTPKRRSQITMRPSPNMTLLIKPVAQAQ